jgi:hypothetical protein
MRTGRRLTVIVATIFFALQSKPGLSQTSSTMVGQPDFPITQLRWWNWSEEEPWQPMQLTVPDVDTTISAYGGLLRRYDVHIAKMFEVSHFFCKQNPNLEGLDWTYDAANGNIYMGNFKISCALASDIANAYDLNRLEPTTISFVDIQPDQSRDNPYSRDYLVPVLNISTNRKILRWRNYVQIFKPFFSEAIRKADSEVVLFPASRIFKQLKGKTQIPILIPTEVPNFEPLADIINDRFDVEASAHSYSICS